MSRHAATTPGGSIPWASMAAWTAIQDAIHVVIRRRHHTDISALRARARHIRWGLERLHARMERLCRATCRYCPSPCCASASPWYDFTDLLINCLAADTPPPGQPVGDYRDRCRYLGNSGCRMPRLGRPWICTWYTCPPQSSRLGRHPAHHRAYRLRIARIQSERRRLESMFIHTALSPPTLDTPDE